MKLDPETILVPARWSGSPHAVRWYRVGYVAAFEDRFDPEEAAARRGQVARAYWAGRFAGGELRQRFQA